MLTRQSPAKKDQHAGIHIVPNCLCNGKVLLKGPPSNQQVTCTLRYTTTTTRSCWGSCRRTQKIASNAKWLLSQIKGRPPWPGIWTQREILLSVEWWLEKQTSVEPRSYKVLPCWLQLYEGTLSVHHQRLHRDPSRRSSHIAWVTQSSSAGTVFTGLISIMKKLKIRNGRT